MPATGPGQERPLWEQSMPPWNLDERELRGYRKRSAGST
jgi:hypothetical protein